MKRIFIDFETYSPLELTEVGVHKYAEPDSACILLFGYAVDDGPVEMLEYGKQHNLPDDFFEQFDEVWAHNAQFELTMANRFLLRDFGIAPPRLEQMHCTSVLCRIAGYPSSLEKAAKILKLQVRKKRTGKSLIAQFCKPNEAGGRTHLSDSPVDAQEFIEYCKKDVEVEREIHYKLRHFRCMGWMREVQLFDMRFNARGFKVDVSTAVGVLPLVESIIREHSTQFLRTTGVEPTQRDAVRLWFYTNGVDLEDTQETTIAEARKLHPNNKALELFSLCKSSALTKLKKILECVNQDGRVRGCFRFYGAGTGRWSGELVQPQNFKKPLRSHEPDSDTFFKDLVEGLPRSVLEPIWGYLPSRVDSCIRNFISGPLFDADASQIEARISCWLAGQEDVLELFRTGGDPYKDMASSVFNVPIAKVEKYQRAVGKELVLGCCFGLGHAKLHQRLQEKGLKATEMEAKKFVRTYRKRYDKIVDLWDSLEDAAIEAVATGNTVKCCNPVPIIFRTLVTGGLKYLAVTLPSGRDIYYPDPVVAQGKLTFMAEVKGAWIRTDIWGGTWLENIAQAIAFDFIANSILNAVTMRYTPTLLVHDQALSEPQPGQTAKEFGSILSIPPAWAKDFPLVFESELTPYYQ
jgi:DNA polymerase